MNVVSGVLGALDTFEFTRIVVLRNSERASRGVLLGWWVEELASLLTDAANKRGIDAIVVECGDDETQMDLHSVIRHSTIIVPVLVSPAFATCMRQVEASGLPFQSIFPFFDWYARGRKRTRTRTEEEEEEGKGGEGGRLLAGEAGEAGEAEGKQGKETRTSRDLIHFNWSRF